MDLDFFFKGMQNKETSASAWLATLLHHNAAFRREFLGLVGVEPPLDPARRWVVNVETPLSGPCDVTLEDEDTLVFLEDKVSASAKTKGQFLRYYLGALDKPDLAAKRLVGVYLGPSVSTGDDERESVTGHPEFSGRRAAGFNDDAKCLGWKDNLSDVVEVATTDDDWFARKGLAAILAHIVKVEGGRPFNQQREDLRQLMKRVAQRVMAAGREAGWGPKVRLERWAGIGYEAQYTPTVGITTFLTLWYDEDEDPPYDLHGVVVDNRIRARGTVSFNPSVKHGRRDTELMARWASLTAAGCVEVPGIGEVPLVNEITFTTGVELDKTVIEVEELLVAWGTAVLGYLREYRSS
jgi:hypothetical protein